MPFRYLGIPLSGVYLKVVDYTPLLDRVPTTLRTWSGIESFCLGILPISGATLDRITCLCRRFLWGDSYTKVAWNTICLDKQYGGLGMRDTKRWNEKTNFPPLIKKLPHIRDYFVLNRGSVDGAIQTMSSWVVCLKFNASLAYDFFKPKPWAKIVWNRALPPKFSFFFLLAHEESTQHLFFVCKSLARCLSKGLGCN
ncbi:hypothetical protein M9H77_04028 [Catharanthus roseus]|uniref:Uncharacterized protein n=1 Tax=Catharanthus roseus TaxID=4058 RepID=A0ACC0CD52_CATRO|nr:hypothetical protein M9H77_04028 [Catharanthus roseus]